MCYCKGMRICNHVTGECALIFQVIIGSAWVTVQIGRQLEDWFIVELDPIIKV